MKELFSLFILFSAYLYREHILKCRMVDKDMRVSRNASSLYEENRLNSSCHNSRQRYFTAYRCISEDYDNALVALHDSRSHPISFYSGLVSRATRDRHLWPTAENIHHLVQKFANKQEVDRSLFHNLSCLCEPQLFQLFCTHDTDVSSGQYQTDVKPVAFRIRG